MRDYAKQPYRKAFASAASPLSDRPAAVSPAPTPSQLPAPDQLGHRFARIAVSASGRQEGQPDAASSEAIRQAAHTGVRTPAGQPPYLDRIQRSFGPHDVSQLRAHVGPQATASARAAQARAYTAGDQLVFAGQPDLFTVAHEAAHAVQQRLGVSVPGGIGAAGDPYERHADAVAERVAGGHSAAPLLDQFAARHTGGPSAYAASPAHRGLGTPAAPIQRTLDRSVFIRNTKPGEGMDEAFRNRIISAIDRYNKEEQRGDDSEASTHRQLETLDTIEHELYAWLIENKAEAQNASRAGVFQLLDEVQREHKRMIARTVETDASLWVKDDVSAEERADIDAIWNDIVAGNGPFNILETIHTEDGPRDLPPNLLEQFRTEVFANLARLMSRPKGRQLIRALRDGSADEKDVTFVVSPLYKLLGTPGYGQEHPYVGARAVATNEHSARFKMANRRIKPGQGSASGVEIAPGVRDSRMMDFDREGDLIPSPQFVGIGHELIHAAHYQQGTYIGQRPQVGDPHAHLPEGYEDDVEEFLTIAPPQTQQRASRTRVRTAVPNAQGQGTRNTSFPLSKLQAMNANIPTEADIRAEHGLGAREGHTTTANPNIFPGATSQQNPGQHIDDAKRWAQPLVRRNAPQPAQGQNQPAPAPQVAQRRVTPELARWLLGLGFAVAVGAIVSVHWLYSLGWKG